MANISVADGSVCGVAELELFDDVPTQIAVENGMWVQYRPVSALTNTGPVEFMVPGSGDQYTDLRNTRFHVTAKIRKRGGEDLQLDDKVAPSANFLHGLFKQIDIYLNGVLVTNSDNMYPYRAILETLMTFSHSAVDSQLQTALFYKDEGHKMDLEANTGFANRCRLAKRSASMEMCGRIHADLFHQSKYLVNGVDMRIIFNRSNDEFSLHSMAVNADGVVLKDYYVEIEDVSLMVRKVDVNPEIRKNHLMRLMKEPMIYPLKRVELKTVSIPMGNRVAYVDNLFLGQKPTRIVIAFAKNDTIHGNMSKNAYNFEHFHLNHLSLHSEGQQIPRKAITPDFATDQYLDAYLTLFTGTNQYLEDTGLIIDRTDYGGGYAIYCFDFSPELCRGAYKQPLKRGAVRLEATFAEDLATTINVLIYSEFDNTLSVDRERNVFTDF